MNWPTATVFGIAMICATVLVIMGKGDVVIPAVIGIIVIAWILLQLLD